MSRLPYSAKTLVSQLGERYKNVDYEAGDPDGLNVRRTLTFKKSPTATFLAKILPVLNDPRIADWSEKRSGGVAVTFVADRRSDLRDRFALDDAEAVANDGPSGDGT